MLSVDFCRELAGCADAGVDGDSGHVPDANDRYCVRLSYSARIVPSR